MEDRKVTVKRVNDSRVPTLFADVWFKSDRGKSNLSLSRGEAIKLKDELVMLLSDATG